MDDNTWNIPEAALDLICPRCKAQPGERCETASGNVAELHSSRWNPLSIAFGEGYVEGCAAGEVRAKNRVQR